jgi:hypothetical protein
VEISHGRDRASAWKVWPPSLPGMPGQGNDRRATTTSPAQPVDQDLIPKKAKRSSGISVAA